MRSSFVLGCAALGGGLAAQEAPLPSGCPEFEVAMPQERPGGVVKAADFGLSETSERNDIAINAAIAEAQRIGAARVELAPGMYKCFDGVHGRDGTDASTGAGIFIVDFADFTFDGKGATLVFRREHAPLESQSELLEGAANFEIKRCNRAIIENFNIDWDWENDPLAVWGVAVAKHIDEENDDASYIDFELETPHPQYPKQVPIQLINPMSATKIGPRMEPGRGPRAFFGTSIGHVGAKSAWLSPVRLRVWPHVKPTSGYISMQMLNYYSSQMNRDFVRMVDIGGTFSIAHHYYGVNGIVMDSNRNLTLRNVDIWGCWGMGVGTRGAQQFWQLVNVNVRPQPGTRRPVSSTADAHHVEQSMGYGKMIDCEVTMNQDDFMNLHDRTQVARTKSARSVEIVNTRGIAYTLFRKGSFIGLKNEDFSDTGWSGHIENIDGEIVTFDRDLPPQPGRVFVLIDRTFATENFIIKNCHFHDSPGSRIVVQGNNITFTDCVFGPMKGTPLKFGSCYTYNVWCEGIGCSNIVVRGCRFENCLEENLSSTPPTQIHAVITIPADGGYWPLRGVPIANTDFAAQFKADLAAGRQVTASPRGVCDILVEGCTFVNPRGYVFYAKNGSGFTLRDNKIEWRNPPCGKGPFAGIVHIEGETDRPLEALSPQ